MAMCGLRHSQPVVHHFVASTQPYANAYRVEGDSGIVLIETQIRTSEWSGSEGYRQYLGDDIWTEFIEPNRRFKHGNTITVAGIIYVIDAMGPGELPDQIAIFLI